MHTSIPISPCEFINITPLNPLISKCQIKVCYVSDEPNRNGSIITKEVATKMANSLPGSPIVGYYNKAAEDYEGHAQELVIEGNDIFFKDCTIPYGFVDINAKVWFQKFLDDNAVEHEYLVTEGYIWTGQFPEAQRIIDKGNNQSMELDQKRTQGTWTKDENNEPQFFIINETNVSKLCVLGEDVEPCFEGSQIKSQFSLDEKFLQPFYAMVQELKEILGEGGTTMNNETIVNEEVVVEEASTEPVSTEEISAEEETVENFSEEQGQTSENEVVENSENNEGIVENESIEEGTVEESVPEATETHEYSLDDIPEYTELNQKYSTLQQDYEELQTRFSNLEAEVNGLRTFKLQAERVEKENLIKQFYMLSDSDKKEVIDNIDKYSLAEIESKLSVICFRNKVSFSVNEEKEEVEETLTYNLNVEDELDAAPAWVKAVRATAKEEK